MEIRVFTLCTIICRKAGWRLFNSLAECTSFLADNLNKKRQQVCFSERYMNKCIVE